MAAKKILIINGHPNSESFSYALSESYKKGAILAGAEVEEIIIGKLDFKPNLQFGYQKRTELEPDLLNAQKKIEWAEHIIWIYPVWWSGIPAIMKGFIDRTFLPGFAFQHRKNSILCDKLLKGKSSRLICTLDQPTWTYKLFFRQPSHYMMERGVLKFCGIKPVFITAFGPINRSSVPIREKWLSKVEKLGFNNQ